jgi:hypothetical protein
MPNTTSKIVLDLFLAGAGFGIAIAGRSIVGSPAAPVGGGVYPAVAFGCVDGPSTIGAEKFSVLMSRWLVADSGEPSFRQKLILSSNSPLHFGQTFISGASLGSGVGISRPS